MTWTPIPADAYTHIGEMHRNTDFIGDKGRKYAEAWHCYYTDKDCSTCAFGRMGYAWASVNYAYKCFMPVAIQRELDKKALKAEKKAGPTAAGVG